MTKHFAVLTVVLLGVGTMLAQQPQSEVRAPSPQNQVAPQLQVSFPFLAPSAQRPGMRPIVAIPKLPADLSQYEGKMFRLQMLTVPEPPNMDPYQRSAASLLAADYAQAFISQFGDMVSKSPLQNVPQFQMLLAPRLTPAPNSDQYLVIFSLEQGKRPMELDRIKLIMGMDAAALAKASLAKLKPTLAFRIEATEQ